MADFDFKIGEIEYTITGKVSESAVNGVGAVKACANWDNNHDIYDIVIPEMVEHENKKYKVTCIHLYRCIRATIPSSVTSIERLYGCHDIVIPSSVTSIERLDYCKDITIPSSVTSIERLVSCKDITIPSSVTSIERLESCKEDITIPSSVTSIEGLYWCHDIVIPSSVTSIKWLHGCKDITIPSSVTSIKSIYSCENITILSSATNISEVDGEVGVTILKIQSMVPPTVGKVIHMSKDDCLIVPKGALDAYKSHPLWGKFKNITEDPSLKETGTINQQPTVPTQGNAGGGSASEISELRKELAALKQEVTGLKSENASFKQQLATMEANYKELASKVAAASAARPVATPTSASKDTPNPQPKPEPKPAATTQPSTPTAPSAKGVFKLEEYKSKGRLCHAIVKTYFEQHPDVTLAQLKQVFNVPKCDHIVESLDVAMTIKDSTGKAGGDFYIKEADQIKIKECTVVVWSYWPERYYPDFIANAKKAGFTIE